MAKIWDILFNEDLVPHGYCFSWRTELIWLHAISDIVIALAYFAIPITIFIICRKRRSSLPFAWVFGMFAAFIFLCGMTHLMELIGIWAPLYYLEGLLKVMTAAISLATAIIMFPLIPVLIQKFEDLERLTTAKKE